MRGSIECKNASKESLSESVEVNKVLDVSVVVAVVVAFADKLVACVVSVSSSYIIESAGVKRKEGAANNNPPVASFLPLESLVVDLHTLPGGLHCERGMLCCVFLTVAVVAERIMFIVDFIVVEYV